MPLAPKRFWEALETIDADGAVLTRWQQLLGPELEAVTRYLRPLSEPAIAWPCLRPGGCGAEHQVITHGCDDHVAVCDPDLVCEPIPLADSDLVLYEADVDKTTRDIATALGIAAYPPMASSSHRVWSIGEYMPTAGFRFPVCFIRAVGGSEFQTSIAYLAADVGTPFIVAAPTRRRLAAASERVLRDHKAIFLSLEEELHLSAEGFVARRSIGELFSGLGPRPAVDDPERCEFFMTPPRATWPDLQIAFVDNHTVSVRIGEARRVLNYAQMGMADRRTSRPNKQWELLRTFAEEHGLLDWSSRHADRRNQKRRELLGQALQAFFRIDGDPFTAEGNGWRARFSIAATA
jgi:hypothetical protein